MGLRPLPPMDPGLLSPRCMAVLTGRCGSKSPTSSRFVRQAGATCRRRRVFCVTWSLAPTPFFLPFWDKRIELNPSIKIWRAAFGQLKASDSAIVWGYSLPPSDVKASLVFQLALDRRSLNLCVIDPSIGTRDRWRAICPNAKFWEFDSVEQFLTVNPPWWRDK